MAGILSNLLQWGATRLYIIGFKGAAFWIIRKLYQSTEISEIYRLTSDLALHELYKEDVIALAKNSATILTEYAEYLLTNNRNHDQLSAQTLAFESKFNELLPKNYPAAAMCFEAHRAAKREDVSLALLKEIKLMIEQKANDNQKSMKLMQHDIDLFKEFDTRFPEAKIIYSLYRISTTTKYSNYDSSIWYDILYWLEKVSNSFLNEDVQQKGQELLKTFDDLILFASMNYFTDHNNWSRDDDSNVTEQKWREINEARIFKWEPDIWNQDLYNEREAIIINGIQQYVPAVENAYKAFRMAVKRNLGV